MELVIGVITNPLFLLALVCLYCLKWLLGLSTAMRVTIATYDKNFITFKKHIEAHAEAINNYGIIIKAFGEHIARLNTLENIQEPPVEWGITQGRIDKIIKRSGIHQQAAYRKLVVNFGKEIDEEKTKK